MNPGFLLLLFLFSTLFITHPVNSEETVVQIEPVQFSPSMFLVEDIDGDRMVIQVDPTRQDALDALIGMAKTGQTMWVGGEIERFENEFGFRFKADTIVVAEITAEGLQAGKYKYIQEDIGYWEGLGTVYIDGKVVAVEEKFTVKDQDTSFNVTTFLSNGSVKSIGVDTELTSIILTIETSSTEDGELIMILPRVFIDSKINSNDDSFVVIVNGERTDYEEHRTTATERELILLVFAGAEEIEIFGTQVIPEFPVNLMGIMAIGLIGAIILLRIKITAEHLA